jgi:peptide/nickel transport system permease protein
LFKSGQAYIVWRKFRRNRASLVGAVIVGTVILMALLAWVIAPYSPTREDWVYPSRKFLPPNMEHLFGTDSLGRDVFSYVVWGAQSSIIVAIGTVTIETVIALIIGATAGYYGGLVDDALMRICDLVLTIPTIILLIVAVSMFKVRSIAVIMVVMGILWWPWMARIIRSEFLTIKSSAYVEAARSMGASDWRIILRHILPNAISPIIVTATIDIAAAILNLAALTFLGLGDPLAVNWGNIINEGHYYLRSAWWITTFPGIAIFMTTVGFNLLGDGLRDAFDIKTRI